MSAAKPIPLAQMITGLLMTETALDPVASANMADKIMALVNGHAAVDGESDGIRGPLRTSDRQHLTAWAASLGIERDNAEALISSAATKGYVNGFKDAEPQKPYSGHSTDLAKRLRGLHVFGPDHFPLLQQAADEIDRYYNGMLAWKQTAEAKDQIIIDLRGDLGRKEVALESAYSRLVELEGPPAEEAGLSPGEQQELQDYVTARALGKNTDREIMEEWDRHYLPGKKDGTPFLNIVVNFARHWIARNVAAAVPDPDAERLAKLLEFCTEAKPQFGRGGELRAIAMKFKNSVETSTGYRNELRKLIDEMKPTPKGGA